ncbi:hypothetical protein [Sphingobium olei]|uniref:Extradiol ring-cleavage dioxygenase LigAB LigA subunit domain-containing protein n=1 Tax=Sphingobium olei TaxID=420955 RepID=A0ABW3P103_9SPHN
MKAAKRFTAFLRLQNMLLNDFVREGLARQSLGRDEADRLLRLAALNAAEAARWQRDLSLPASGCTGRRAYDG